MDPTNTQAELYKQLVHNNLPFDHAAIFIITQLIPGFSSDAKLNWYFSLTGGSLSITSIVLWIVLIPLLLLVLFLLWKAAWFLVNIWRLSKESKEDNSVFLEVRPPRSSAQSHYSTAQLFNVIHGLGRSKTSLFGLQKTYSLEIAASRETGIRYFIKTPVEDKESIKKTLLSYLPGVKVEESPDYLPTQLFSSDKAMILHLKQSGSFYFPIRSQKSLEKHDPISYLTGSMARLQKDELMTVQLVIKPASKKIRSQAARIESKLLRNSSNGLFSRQESGFPSLLKVCGFILLSIPMLPLGIFAYLMSGGKSGSILPHKHLLFSNPAKSETGFNTHQEEVSHDVGRKVSEQLFEVSFRVLFLNETSGLRLERERSFLSSLSLFTNGGWQSLQKASNLDSIATLPLRAFRKLSVNLLKARSSLFSPMLVLSASELSDLYHFPYSPETEPEDLMKQRSKDLPAPLSLKASDPNLDINLGVNSYAGQQIAIGLTKEERRLHTYVIGATGTGKSNLLANMIVQDIKNGKGLAVIDPHGDLISNVLSEIPENRIKDVVFLNPDDEDFPTGLNLMEMSKDGVLSESREKDFIVSSLVSLFQKLYPPKSWGTRMEYILRNAALTALELENPTLFTIQRLLTEKDFRDYASSRLKVGLLKKFWIHEFKMAGDYQKIQMISPITNKIGRFFGSGIAKNIVGQTRSTIDFDDILNRGKILLCDLSQGKIGEDNSELLGIVTIAKIQLAALKRARFRQEDRKDFYLYVDEFQNFATPSFGKIMSEARKYRLNAILAHQTTAQIEDKDLLKVILANCGTIISFRTAGPSDEDLLLPIFSPSVDKNEISNLPSYHFYMKISTSNSNGALSGSTVKFDPNRGSSLELEVIENSRKLYARAKEEVEQEFDKSLMMFPSGNKEVEAKRPVRKTKRQVGRLGNTRSS
jgi:Type IV secretion-system coupling protein DNA-binding domain/TraM recognition site of TraD and TraG